MKSTITLYKYKSNVKYLSTAPVPNPFIQPSAVCKESGAKRHTVKRHQWLCDREKTREDFTFIKLKHMCSSIQNSCYKLKVDK